MRRLVLVAASWRPPPSAAGVGSGSAATSSRDPPRRSPGSSIPPQFYQRLGRLAAGDPHAVRRHRRLRRGPGDSVIAVLGLSLENRAFAFQREGNSFVARYRVSPLLQARRRAAGGPRPRGAGPGRHLPGDPARRRERPLPAGPPSRPGHLQGDRHRARRLVDRGEQRRPRSTPRPSSARRPTPRRSSPTRRRGGEAAPIRSPWCSIPAAPWATAATRCSPTSRATASPGPTTVPFEVLDEQEQHDLQRLAAVPRGQGSGEPGRPARARQRLARRAARSWWGSDPERQRVGAGLVHPGLGGDQLRRDARPAPLLRPRRADRRDAPRPGRRARPALARLLRGHRSQHRHARRTRRSTSTSAG